MKARASEIMKRMGVDLDVESQTELLGLHQQQIVEIAKALCRGTSLLILDEPTAILNAQEKQRLFKVLRELRNQGICIIFITHFVGELFEVCDRLTVMRDGRTVHACAISDTNYDSVVAAMVGSAPSRIDSPIPREDTRKPLLSMHAGTITGKFTEVSVAVCKGEIVGLAGLVGSGCYEVAEAIFGLRRLDRGEIRLEGQVVHLRSPLAAVRAGIGYVPEDRRKEGLSLNLSGSVNSVLPSISNRRFSRLGFIRIGPLRREFVRLGKSLRLRPLDPRLPASGFSGGNQQKLVISKWIEKGFRAYILVEPTRGVDVGAKVEILKFIEQLGRQGAAIILVATDFDDIAAVCESLHRVYIGKDLRRTCATLHSCRSYFDACCCNRGRSRFLSSCRERITGRAPSYSVGQSYKDFYVKR